MEATGGLAPPSGGVRNTRHPDAREGPMAFLEKRSPRWKLSKNSDFPEGRVRGLKLQPEDASGRLGIAALPAQWRGRYSDEPMAIESTRPARPYPDEVTEEDMADRLHLEPVGPGVFLRHGHRGERHLFGGLRAAQAMRAASLTVAGDKAAISIHGHFLIGGDARRPLEYRVEPTRDGRSFCTRRVEVTQDRSVLFVATVSFQAAEAGPDYQPSLPAGVPEPEDLAPGRYASAWFDSRDVPEEWSSDGGPCDSDPGRHSPSRNYLDGPDTFSVGVPEDSAFGRQRSFGEVSHRRLAWFRTRKAMPDDAGLHAQAVVYLTDHGATRAIRQPHATHLHIEQRMSVSLDHTVWLHAPARADEWLLSEYRPLATGAGRGLAAGSVWTRQGELVASMAQEALLRVP